MNFKVRYTATLFKDNIDNYLYAALMDYVRIKHSRKVIIIVIVVVSNNFKMPSFSN